MRARTRPGRPVVARPLARAGVRPRSSGLVGARPAGVWRRGRRAGRRAAGRRLAGRLGRRLGGRGPTATACSDGSVGSPTACPRGRRGRHLAALHVLRGRTVGVRAAAERAEGVVRPDLAREAAAVGPAGVGRSGQGDLAAAVLGRPRRTGRRPWSAPGCSRRTRPTCCPRRCRSCPRRRTPRCWPRGPEPTSTTPVSALVTVSADARLMACSPPGLGGSTVRSRCSADLRMRRGDLLAVVVEGGVHAGHVPGGGAHRAERDRRGARGSSCPVTPRASAVFFTAAGVDVDDHLREDGVDRVVHRLLDGDGLVADGRPRSAARSGVSLPTTGRLLVPS